MPDETANLQKPKSAKEWAKHLGISERQMHKAGEIMRYRPDLMPKVTAKEMSLHAAWLEATGREKDTSWDRLVRAWNSATAEDHARFLEELGLKGEADEIRRQIAICLPDETANLQSED
jgi:hypothetical protein